MTGNGRSATRRDSQRSLVYDAEQLVRRVFDRADESGTRTVELLGSSITLPIERRFASVESVASYVDKVLALNWIRARWPRADVQVRVRERAGATAAHYEPATATLAVPLRAGGWALRELVVLHELSHHLDDAFEQSAPHGPEFCHRYLELVDGMIGSEAEFLLRVTLLDCGVRLG